jgi:threonine dehydrogenase-like Zn-dependent dehydrogenase
LLTVYAADVVDYRLQKAKECGADVLINSANEDLKARLFKETNGDGAGRIVECSGAPAMVNSCFGMCRKVCRDYKVKNRLITVLSQGGAVVLIGLPKAPLHIEDVLSEFIFRAITGTS